MKIAGFLVIVISIVTLNAYWICHGLVHPLDWMQQDAAINIPFESLPKEPTKETPGYPRHILMCLSGDHPGLIGEFQVSLKSILMNLPYGVPTHIHILADDNATLSLETSLVLPPISLRKWKTANPLTITIYSVNKDHMKQQIEQKLLHMPQFQNNTNVLYRHTIGQYFRLLSFDLLPSAVVKEPTLYMDTDTVVLANLEYLWQHHIQLEKVGDHNNDKVNSNNISSRSSGSIFHHIIANQTMSCHESFFFQWGASQCSGFMVLRPICMKDLWKLFGQIQLSVSDQVGSYETGDQFMLRAIQRHYPEWVGPNLPPMYDVHANNGPWWERNSKRAELLLSKRRDGGGLSKDAYFGSNSNQQQEQQHCFNFNADGIWQSSMWICHGNGPKPLRKATFPKSMGILPL